MPNWTIALATILGSGVVAGFVNHKLQQRSERDKEKRAAHAAWIAQQRELCLELLDAVIRIKGQVSTFESIHDNRAARLTMKETLQLAIKDMPAAMEPIRKVRRQLDLEPNAQLQVAIEHFGDAGIAYQQALFRPMSSPLNPIQFYVGKTPKEEVSRLAQDFYAGTTELQEAVRAYMAQIEQPLKAKHTWRVCSRRKTTERRRHPA